MISVVIPTLNEAENLRRLLPMLAADDETIETIIVDGGSKDHSVSIAKEYGASIIASPPGRGRQLAAGAAQAKGDIFLFLHADSHWPRGGFAAIQNALDARPDAPGGNFRLLFNADDGFSRWLNGFYAFIRWLGFYYGDSGLFVRAKIYHALGGVRPIALMEDYDFVRRLERAGRTICVKSPPLFTSSRRFHNRHPIAIVSGWVVIHVLYFIGVSPDTLARLYRSKAH